MSCPPFFILVVLFCFVHPGLAQKNLESPFTNPKAQQLTHQGQNRQAIFVSDNSLLFTSEKRKSHKDPQIYFKDLKTGKERQVSHIRAQITGDIFLSGRNRIFYSSSTDEEKESPLVLKKYLHRFPSSVKNDDFFHLQFQPREIYASQVDGSDIKRITHHSGYDGTPIYVEKKDQIYFSRWSSGQLGFYAKTLKKNLAAWKLSQTQGHDLGLQLSPNQDQFVWNRFSPDFKSSQILLSGLHLKNPQFVTLESGINWSPSWHPNGKSIVYSARASNMNDFDLFEVSIDGQCQRKISSFAGDEFFPQVSPNGKYIIFTSTMSGQEQIHQIDYPTPLNCSVL